MAVKNLLIRGGADFSNVKKELDKAQANLNNFKTSVSKTMGKIKVALGALALGSLIKDSTQMAMSVESSIENINRTMKSSAKVFGEWVNAQSSAFGMSKEEAYKYGSTYSNLISSFNESSSSIATQTQELMKATGIIASKTGRTYEDTAERIRSGMLGSTEAIEDLGVYTQVSMLESTEAFKQLADGKSWQQLNFQTQQQIRLAAILEQTYARYGTTLADTTQTRQNEFIASLKNVKLTLGQAFLPIYNAVLPPLTLLMNTLGRAISIIAQFTTALFGKPKSAQQQAKAISSQASSAGDLSNGLDDASDSAKKTGKALKSLAGFDEINTLLQGSDSSSGSGGGSGSGGEVDTSLGDLDLGEGGFLSSIVEVSEKVQSMADKIKGFFGELKAFIVEHKVVIVSAISGIIGAFATFMILNNYKSILDGVKLAFTLLGGAIGGISLPILLISALIGALVYLWQTDTDFRNSVIETWNGIKETISLVWESFLKPIFKAIGNALNAIWEYALKPLVGAFVVFVKNVSMLVMELWNEVFKPLVDWFVKYLGPVIAVVFNTILAVITGVIIAISAILTGFVKIVSGVIKAITETIKPLITFIKSYFVGAWTFAINLITNILNVWINFISDLFNSVKRIFNGIIDFITGVFTGNWSKAWQGVKDIFGGIMEGLGAVIKAPLNAVIGLINSAISGINKISVDIPDWVPSWAGGGKHFGVNIPSIPMLAKGGVVDSPTLAMVGEAGSEVVMPLENNTGWITELAEKVSSRMPQGSVDNSNSDRPLELIIKIGDTVIGKKAIDGINKITRQTGKCQLIL